MPNLDDLIRYEGENTSLDFKGQTYVRAQHVALVKDVLSMANAHVDGDRYIVCGVLLKPDGTREIRGVPTEAIIDPASYQQLVRENIEPDIGLEYYAHQIAGSRVGVFRIFDCADRPYQMRKALGSMQRGEMWIRKGSHQMRMVRTDLDRIYEMRNEQSRFAGKLQIGFEGPNALASIYLAAAGSICLPSNRASERITRVLSSKRVATAVDAPHLLGLNAFNIPSLGLVAPVEQWSIAELEQALKDIERTYESDDAFEFYELYSHKLNFALYNDSSEHLRSARIDIELATIPGVHIATQTHSRPLRLGPYSSPMTFNSARDLRYPRVSVESGITEISAELKDLRHQMSVKAFGEPLRLVLEESAVGRTLSLKATLRGSNLSVPFVQDLAIHVVGPDGSFPQEEQE